MEMPRTVRQGDLAIGPEADLVILAGLCIVEDFDTTLRHAEKLAEATQDLPITLVFKSSFDKANRSSISSHRGPGMKAGLEILAEVKKRTGLPIVTDVHESGQVAEVAEVADILQIPAFLCRQTDLLVAAAETGKIVNVKKGQFLSPHDMKNVVTKIEEAGSEKVTLTERGNSFGYNTLVNDFRGLPIMRRLGVPVIFDATHSVQQPGGHGSRTGGDRTMVPYLAKAAVAVGVDGLFFEVHETPDLAKSDADNALHLEDFGPLIRKLLAIRQAAAD
ncbi:MAG: 2-dehydro-3-deoxyphosphooctonate aldolase (KDO 8-P synthase) [Planctomycetota bacterium]|jgi:2-dehydro-3-deoxyphosphooctonate aldolase (KDO 8-P synthase)